MHEPMGVIRVAIRNALELPYSSTGVDVMTAGLVTV